MQGGFCDFKTGQVPSPETNTITQTSLVVSESRSTSLVLINPFSIDQPIEPLHLLLSGSPYDWDIFCTLVLVARHILPPEPW